MEAGPSTPPPQAGPSSASAASASAQATSPAAETVPGFESWRRSLAQFTGMGLSDQDKILRDQEEERRKNERDWDKCERWKKEMMTRSEWPGSV